MSWVVLKTQKLDFHRSNAKDKKKNEKKKKKTKRAKESDIDTLKCMVCFFA